jgi:hypothetical protein
MRTTCVLVPARDQRHPLDLPENTDAANSGNLPTYCKKGPATRWSEHAEPRYAEQMTKALAHLLRSSLLTASFLMACGPSSDVPTASCQTNQASQTACKEWGDTSGCKTSSYAAGGCKFSECDEPPNCSSSYVNQDAGSKDAGVDPTCKTADPDGDGVFASKPPCGAPHTLQVNGATSYTCPCPGTCPCGYQCGSIALATGGVISPVCAPAK